MTGAYLRVRRNGAWENIEVEYLTDDERHEIFDKQASVAVVRWLNIVCAELTMAPPTAGENP